MRVILPISLLLSAVVALTVSRSPPSSRCLLSHYVPGSFVILCRDTCVHMHQAYVYSRLLIFLILSPYRLSPILLWIWYFLIPTRSRLSFCYIPLFLLFRRVSFRPLIRHRCYLSYSPYNRIHSLLSPSLPCQSSSHSFVFISCFSLWSAPFPLPLFCFTPLLPRLRAPFSIIISSLAFSTLYLLARSSLYLLNSLNLLDTHRNSRAGMDFHSLRVILAYDGLRA